MEEQLGWENTENVHPQTFSQTTFEMQTKVSGGSDSCLVSAAGDPCAGLVELGLRGFMLISSNN